MLHVGRAADEPDGAVAALEEPEIAVAGHVDESLDGAAVALEVDEDRRRHLVPVPRFVRRVLEVPLDLARGHVHGDRGRRVEVVARALIAHPRPAVAGAPIGDVRLRVVVARHPDRRAARLPLVALRPRLAARFSGRRHRVGPPQFLAAVGIVGGEEAADALFAARRADDDLAVGDERGQAHVVAAPVLGHRARPHLAAACARRSPRGPRRWPPGRPCRRRARRPAWWGAAR